MRATDPRPQTVERRLLAELLSLFDHPLAHGILERCGFADDVSAEAKRRRRYFRDVNIPMVRWDDRAVSLHMAMGYANMKITFADEEVPIESIRAAMLQYCSAELLAYGDELAESVAGTLRASPAHRVAAAVSCAKRFLPNAERLIFTLSAAGI